MPLHGPLRPRPRLRPLLVAAGLIAFAVAAWWALPALAPPAYGPPPTLNESRMRELKANGVGYARIRGMDASASSSGTTVRLFGGYLETDRIVLFLRLDPPGRPSPVEGTTLRDQFGRRYHLTGAVSDIQTGESILYFQGPGDLLAITGLRLALDIDAVDRGSVSDRQQVRLALRTTLVTQTEWSGWLSAYALNMAINYLVLAAAGLLHVGTILGGIRASGARGWVAPFARGLVGGVAFAALMLPTYIAIGTLFRTEPVGPRGLHRPPDDYVPAAMIAFFVIEAAAVLVGAIRAWQAVRAGSAGQRWIPAAAALAVLGFLVLTLPLAEFANACYIGTGFILRPQC